MNFQVVSQQGYFKGSLSESIDHMQKLGAMQAIEVAETGINLAMMRLSNSKTITLEDRECKDIIVTKIS